MLPNFAGGKSFHLKEESAKHKRIVINFWASWCTACIEELSELEALKIKYQKKGVLFVAINAGEKPKKIKKFLRKHKFSYDILEDKDRVLSKSLGVTELPQTMVLDNKMNIIFRSHRPPEKIDL